MATVVKGNRPLRIFAALIFTILVLAHFFGSVDLTTPSVLWIMVLMSINAFQASFTGFCPMFKDKRGNCVACGVQCSETTDTKSSCCDAGGCCGDSEKSDSEDVKKSTS